MMRESVAVYCKCEDSPVDVFCVRGVERRDKIQRIQRNPLMPQHDGGSIVAQCSAKHGIITHSIHKVKGLLCDARTHMF